MEMVAIVRIEDEHIMSVWPTLGIACRQVDKYESEFDMFGKFEIRSCTVELNK